MAVLRRYAAVPRESVGNSVRATISPHFSDGLATARSSTQAGAVVILPTLCATKHPLFSGK